MSPSMRAQQRAAAREARSGAGPVAEGYDPGPHPGAVSKFGLFGEALTVGLLVTIVSIGIVTLPVALAAGIRHLRRYVAADDSRLALFWDDIRIGLLGSLLVGVPAMLIGVVLTVDVLLARSGALPGGELVGAVGWAGLAALATAVLLVAGAWTPRTGWVDALRALPGTVQADPLGAAFIAAAAAFVGVATWALIPLFIPAVGCAVLAVVAVPARRRRFLNATRKDI